MDNSLKQSIAICQIAGCQFTQKEMTDLEKVERGEMTMDDVIEKFNQQLTELKKEKPEYFEAKGIERNEI